MMSCYQHSAFLIFGLFVVNCAITLTSGDELQQEYDICSSQNPNVRLEFPGDSVLVYVHVPQEAANTYSQSCVAEFETCDSCRFKVSAVQSQFEYPECRQASWSESYCPPDCVYMLLLDHDYKSQRRRVTNSRAADRFETESSSLQVVACRNKHSEGLTMKLRITSVEKIQHIISHMHQPLSWRTFTSPNFPSPYVRNNEFYTYTFESSSRDKFITVTFDDWMLSSYSTVKFDGANVVNKITGDNSRPYIISIGKTLNMTFSTGERRRMSSDHNFIGFKGQASFYSKLSDVPHIEPGCDRLLSTTEGGILHLNSAADGQNRDCIWIIKKLSGFDGVYVKIIRYKTRYALMSSCDYSLEVREGLTSSSAQRLRLKPNDYIPNYAVQLSENGFYIRIKGCYFDDAVVLSYAMYLNDCDDYREYYKCDNGRCIADHLKCDTYDHCGDSSDEIPSMCGRTPSRIRTGVGDYSSRNNSNISAASYDYTLSIHIIIPLVVSIILGVGILCLLILLVRRCRRLSNSVVGSRPRNRRARGRGFCWPNRDVQMSVTMSSGEHPPSYEDVIRNTPIGQLNMAFSWSACESLLAQPPSYDEAIFPTSRTASIMPHAALTNSSSSSSGCHRETSSNQPQFHPRPFLVATLSASLYPAGTASVSLEGTSDGTHRLDLTSPVESSQRENTLTSDSVSAGSFISSNQNKSAAEINSQISSNGNDDESSNIPVTDVGARTCPQKRDQMSIPSVSQRNNNKHMNGKSNADSNDENDQLKRTANSARGGMMSFEDSNRNRRLRKALDKFTDDYRTDCGQNAPTCGGASTSGVVSIPDDDDDDVRGHRVSHSSRSHSCADILLDLEKSRLTVANGKRWQEDKRFSYAGVGDVSVIERDLHPSCRDQLSTTPLGCPSGFSTASCDSQRDISRTNNVGSRVCETDTTADPAPGRHKHPSNQVTELSRPRADRQGMPTSLDPVLEKSNEFDVITLLDAATGLESEASRYTDNNASDDQSQDLLSRDKMYPVVCEQYRYRNSNLGKKQMKPNKAEISSKQKSEVSKDNPTGRETAACQNVTSHNQNDKMTSPHSVMSGQNQNHVHGPGDRQHQLFASANNQFQNENKNMSAQTSNNCTILPVKEDGGVHVFPHLQSQSRSSRYNGLEDSQLSQLDQEGDVTAADMTSIMTDARSPKKPVPAPRVRGKNQFFSDF